MMMMQRGLEVTRCMPLRELPHSHPFQAHFGFCLLPQPSGTELMRVFIGPFHDFISQALFGQKMLSDTNQELVHLLCVVSTVAGVARW